MVFVLLVVVLLEAELLVEVPEDVLLVVVLLVDELLVVGDPEDELLVAGALEV